ncbi:Adenylate kinase 2 [Cystobasidiomycetes sp. EMM_F5]
MFTSSLRNNTGQNTRQREALHLVILGAPGAGKGTHTDSLLRSYVIQALVAGNLLREQVSSKTEIGLKAAKIMKEVGERVHDQWSTCGELKSRIIDVKDGYPRTAGQARDLDEALAHNSERINLVVNLDVPDEVLIDRIENRWVHLPSGRIYNTTYNPPKAKGLDDLTGEPLSKRIDDDVDIFKKRLINFHKENAPIKDYYQNQGSLVNLSGRTR